jgi:hypothetical protein
VSRTRRSWVVARRDGAGRWWTEAPMTEAEARIYARRFPEGAKVVGLDLDTLPSLPELER